MAKVLEYMRLTFSALVASAITLSSATAQITEKAVQASAVSKSKAAEKWEPEQFKYPRRLPANYDGVNPKEFLKLFLAKVKSIKKGEFETTKEFEERLKEVDDLLRPIDTRASYAFRIKNVRVSYDADAQVYLIGDKSGFTCDYPSMPYYNEYFSCYVSTTESESDTYTGSNAYGVTREIHEHFYKGLALAVRKDGSSKMVTRLFSVDKQSSFKRTFYDVMPIALDKAKSLHNKTIGVLFVGSVEDAVAMKVDIPWIVPTLNDPRRIRGEVVAVPFELKYIIYYVVDTGEILETKEAECRFERCLSPLVR